VGFALFAQNNDNVDLSNELGSMWDVVLGFLAEKGITLALNVVAAILIFFIGRIISKILRSVLVRLMTKAKVDQTLIKFLSNIAYAILLTLVILAAVNRLGVNTTSFAAAIAAAGLAIGLALQSSLGNFASGIMLILFKPFRVGNVVEVGGITGTVEEIHIFNTILRTGDNVQIHMPNGKISADTIKNFSAEDTRRIDLIVGCSYDDDLRAVKSFLENMLTADDRILTDPEPAVALRDLGESSVDLNVRPWVKNEDYWSVRASLVEQIKLGFDERGFTLPYPQRDVHVYSEQV